MDKMFEKLDMGNVSDGYHTFNELYRYRMLYNAAFFNELAKGDVKVCKSHKHYDGEECFGGGWFIVMAELPTGQISNHYENRYWGLFNIPELETAWKWDGHTPNEVADRIESYLINFAWFSRRKWGFSTAIPSDNVANVLIPKSTPTVLPVFCL